MLKGTESSPMPCRQLLSIGGLGLQWELPRRKAQLPGLELEMGLETDFLLLPVAARNGFQHPQVPDWQVKPVWLSHPQVLYCGLVPERDARTCPALSRGQSHLLPPGGSPEGPG